MIGGTCYVDSSWLCVSYYMIDEKDSENTDWVFAQIIAYREHFSKEELMGDTPTVSEDVLVDLGTNGSFYYSGFRFDQAYADDPTILSECLEGLDETEKAQYMELLSHSTELLDGVEIYAVNIPDPPKITELDPATTMGYVLQDIDGNDVKLGDVIAATPTSYFVDSNGKILESVMGARSEGYWEDILEKYLPNMQ
ncbi:MAG: hypothetical protein J5518_04690 [Lachnospiraceae bacterium]|nr:hypothetical protein [Lachnospiraceae bacterium]